MRLLGALFLAILSAVWAEPVLAGEHAVGFTAGGTSASGFTYRYFGEHGLGAQVTGFFFHSTGSFAYSIGGQALWAFQEASWGRLYGVAGVGSYSWQSLIYGAGPGIELGGERGATLAIELPIAYFQGNVIPFPNVSYLFKF